MDASTETSRPMMSPQRRASRDVVAPIRAAPIYTIEAMASMGGTLFTVGIFFYMKDRFGWGLSQNFRLAATQGMVYVVGALLANFISSRVSHQRAMLLLQGLMGLICVLGLPAANIYRSPGLVTAVVLAYTFVSAMTWPILESLVAIGAAGDFLSKRLATYNVVWPVVGAGTIAVSGLVIESFPVGVFLFPAIAHGLAVVCAVFAKPLTHRDEAGGIGNAVAVGHPTAERELLRQRTVALWVSRLALPATYAVIYGLMPLMPSLPAMERLDTKSQTVVSSVWLAARWLTFVGLAMNTWWHSRPKALVAAAVLMFIAFVGITVAPSQVAEKGSYQWDLAALLCWQTVLGACLGLIYSGSLYFGMVLSEGSTEHSGYHEALIGLGWVLGPIAGVLMQILKPGDMRAGIWAVGTVIAMSAVAVVAASVYASIRAKRTRQGYAV